MDIICLKCGCVNEYEVVIKSNQKTAWCTVCKSYIKNIQHAEKQKLHFGKYKDRFIDSMKTKEETSYLHWLLNSSIKLSNPLKDAIKKHLGL